MTTRRPSGIYANASMGDGVSNARYSGGPPSSGPGGATIDMVEIWQLVASWASRRCEVCGENAEASECSQQVVLSRSHTVRVT